MGRGDDTLPEVIVKVTRGNMEGGGGGGGGGGRARATARARARARARGGIACEELVSSVSVCRGLGLGGDSL